MNEYKVGDVWTFNPNNDENVCNFSYDAEIIDIKTINVLVRVVRSHHDRINERPPGYEINIAKNDLTNPARWKRVEKHFNCKYCYP